MSLKQHLERKEKEMLKMLQEQHAEELRLMEASLKEQLTSLEADYKRMVENEVNLRVAQRRFAIEKEKRFELEKLQNEQIEKLYQEVFEKMAEDSAFLSKFVDAFFKEVDALEKVKDAKIVAYGKYGKALHDLAKKKTDIAIEVKEGASSGIKYLSEEIEVDCSFDQLMEKVKNMTMHEVFVALFS